MTACDFSFTFTGSVNIESDYNTYDFDDLSLNNQDLVKLSGAPDGSTLNITFDDINQTLILKTQSDFYQEASERWVVQDENGKHLIWNINLSIKPQYQNQGLGVKILRQQIRTAYDLGFQSIRVEAAGSRQDPDYIGYYVWANMGFNAPIPKNLSLPDELTDAKTILDLIAQPNGKEWWKHHGCTFDGEFDLSPDSPSLITFEKYLNEKWEMSLWE